MNSGAVVDLVREMLLCAFWVGLPLLVTGLAVGVVVSILQILTSIQDPAFGAVPRLVAFLAGLIVFLPWMLTRLCNYTTLLVEGIPRYAR
jgi:flagellar biosynthetic protein FliQ